MLLRRAPGARSVTVARSLPELLAAFDVLSAAGPGNVLVQEYIPGGPDTIWMFNGYFDRQASCRFGATAVKLRQCPPGTGPTSLGVVRGNPAVRRTAEAFLGALGYTGIVDLGFRYDARDGSYRLLDVNPRIGGTFRLFTGLKGVDVVRALYLDATGQTIPDDAAVEGRRWQDEPHDLLAQAVYRRQGTSPWRTWLASSRSVDERAWYAVDDLRPFAVMWRHVGSRAGRGLSRVVATGRRGAVGEPRGGSTVPPVAAMSVPGNAGRQEWS
jgi:predicted ATP-grasp superfamily ATP-dependent carboligase